MRENGGGSSSGFGSLLRALVQDGLTLARQEVRLVRVEAGARAKRYGIGTITVASGVVLALIGVVTTFIGIVLLPGDQWLRDRYWLAALVVTALMGAITMWCVRRGAVHLDPARLRPDESVESLKEDKEWLRRQLQR